MTVHPTLGRIVWQPALDRSRASSSRPSVDGPRGIATQQFTVIVQSLFGTCVYVDDSGASHPSRLMSFELLTQDADADFVTIQLGVGTVAR